MPNSARYLLALLFLPAAGWAQADLTTLNLEDLAKVEVTSASRKSESLSSAQRPSTFSPRMQSSKAGF
jgi:hypothetical protein